jgi:hypothetical protein
VSVDRELLEGPWAEMRRQLAEAGIAIYVPPGAIDQVRAAFRLDLMQVGVDTGNLDQVGGAVAGLTCSLKMLNMIGLADANVVAHFVGLYDIIVSLLDVDYDAEVSRLSKSWGLPDVDQPDLPPLPTPPTGDRPTMVDMSGWASRLAAAQPDLHMTPEQIIQKATEAGALPGPAQMPGAWPDRRFFPTPGGPQFRQELDGEMKDQPRPRLSCGHTGAGYSTVPVDEFDVALCGGCTHGDGIGGKATARIIVGRARDDAAEPDDDEIADAEIIDDDEPEPEQRAQRRSWWGTKGKHSR